MRRVGGHAERGGRRSAGDPWKKQTKKGVSGRAKEKSSDDFRIGRKGGTGGGTKKEDIEHVPPHPSPGMTAITG